MTGRQSIADFVLPRTPRPASTAAAVAPVVPSFEELWPDVDRTPLLDPAPVNAQLVEPAVDAEPAVEPVVEIDDGTDSDTDPVAGTATDDVPAAGRSDLRPGTVPADAPPAGRPGPAERQRADAATTTTHDEGPTVFAPTAFTQTAFAPTVSPTVARPEPRDARILGVRHAARHQAARADIGGLHEMMRHLLAAGGSDLHLTALAPPTIRVHGDLRRLPDHGPMSAVEVEGLVRGIVDGEQWHAFESTNELDFAYTATDIGRFRVNAYRQRGSVGAAFRAIPTVIPPLPTLGLPPQVEAFAHLPRGLVLVTGPTGSGKTTTLASLLALANQLRAPHIVTIEDPIEFLHDHGAGLVNQREVGGDTASFAAALKHALRQDPDIVLVGELRDLETTATALTAAETGHLVFATLHTQSAAQTVDRVIDIFPAHQQGEIRAQLSSTLRGVVTQSLVQRADTPGRAVVAEIMVSTPAIANLIREGKTHQIPSFMQAGGRDGMLSFDQHLASLVQRGVIAWDRALTVCHSADEFGRLVRGAAA